MTLKDALCYADEAKCFIDPDDIATENVLSFLAAEVRRLRRIIDHLRVAELMAEVRRLRVALRWIRDTAGGEDTLGADSVTSIFEVADEALGRKKEDAK